MRSATPLGFAFTLGLGLVTAGLAGELTLSGSQNFNSANTHDIRLFDLDIEPNGVPNNYGVLLNANLTGENCDIVSNKIYSPTSDAIEINTLSDFSGIRVIGNTLYGGPNGTSSNAGFSLGIAAGKDIAVTANISKLSRLESLHIEDAQRNLTLTGNIFTNCGRDGARLLCGSGGSGDPVILTGNIFTNDPGQYHANNGIYMVYDSSGVVQDCMLTANRISGFQYGLFSPGGARIAFANNLIEDCTTAIYNGSGRVDGTTYATDCGTLVMGGAGSVTGKVVSATAPTTILQYVGTSGYCGATLQGFAFPYVGVGVPSGYSQVHLFALPRRMVGRLTVKALNNYDFITCTCRVVWDGTTLTTTDMVEDHAGAIVPVSGAIGNDGGQLALYLYAAGARTLARVTVDFDGTFYQR